MKNDLIIQWRERAGQKLKDSDRAENEGDHERAFALSLAAAEIKQCALELEQAK